MPPTCGGAEWEVAAMAHLQTEANPALTIDELRRLLNDPSTPLEVLTKAVIPSIVPVLKGPFWSRAAKHEAIHSFIGLAHEQYGHPNQAVRLKAREQLARALSVLGARAKDLAPVLIQFYSDDARHSALKIKRDADNVRTFVHQAFGEHRLSAWADHCEHQVDPTMLLAIVRTRTFGQILKDEAHLSCYYPCLPVLYAEVVQELRQLPEPPILDECPFSLTSAPEKEPSLRFSKADLEWAQMVAGAAIRAAAWSRFDDSRWWIPAAARVMMLLATSYAWETRQLASIQTSPNGPDTRQFVYRPALVQNGDFVRCNLCHDWSNCDIGIQHLSVCPSRLDQPWHPQFVFGTATATKVLAAGSMKFGNFFQLGDALTLTREELVQQYPYLAEWQ